MERVAVAWFRVRERRHGRVLERRPHGGYHGYTDGYATVNGSFGVKWQSGAITTTVKVNNVFNQTVHQHIFGDLLRRTVLGEIKFRL